MRILAINPGSTSTKIAVFEENKEIFTKNLKHTVEELAPYKKIIDQYDFRRDVIVKNSRQPRSRFQASRRSSVAAGWSNPSPAASTA